MALVPPMTFDPTPLRLETRARRQIRNSPRREQDPIRLRAAIAIHTSRPSVQLRSATGVYNCYGLIFASRRTWIDTEDPESEVEKILEDDGYARTPAGKSPEIGDVILYRDGHGFLTHAALVVGISPETTQNIRLISQWGAAGEYSHHADDVSSWLGQPSEIWSDRKVLP